jgi:DNA-binding IclR family transcriptional regulator
VATAFLEGQVNNAQLQQITGLHAANLTRLIGKPVAGGYLSRDGRGRGSHYRLSTETTELPAGLRESLEQALGTPGVEGSR